MKRFICLLLTLSVMLSFAGGCSYAADGAESARARYIQGDNVGADIVKMIFNVSGREVNVNLKKSFSEQTFISEANTAFVPLRILCENLGATVEWSENGNINIKKEDISLSVSVGSKNAKINGADSQLPDAVVITKDTAMVPVRAIAEALGAEVRYDEMYNRVIVAKRDDNGAWNVDRQMIDEIKTFVLEKTMANSEGYDGMVPHATKNGKYVLMDNPGWVAGFYTGLNYMCYDWSGDERYVGYAKEVFPMLTDYLYNDPEFYHHDLGFTFVLSYYQDYLETGSEESKKVVIDAADVLMGRFTDKGYIRGWNVWGGANDTYGQNNRYRMICDSMCNIPILFIASELTGDDKYYKAACSQADLTNRYLVRKDFTTTHTFVFYPDGEPRYEQQWQGATDSSCWSRGHSWVINGMAYAYKVTGDERYLNSAKDLADTYFLMTDEDLIPHWDFIFKGNDTEPRDTSAASVTACGLMQIYDATGDEFYKNMAYKILCRLYVDYSSADEPENQGIINHATGNKPQKQNIDISLIYGDYYFAELAERFANLDI